MKARKKRVSHVGFLVPMHVLQRVVTRIGEEAGKRGSLCLWCARLTISFTISMSRAAPTLKTPSRIFPLRFMPIMLHRLFVVSYSMMHCFPAPIHRWICRDYREKDCQSVFLSPWSRKQ